MSVDSRLSADQTNMSQGRRQSQALKIQSRGLSDWSKSDQIHLWVTLESGVQGQEVLLFWHLIWFPYLTRGYSKRSALKMANNLKIKIISWWLIKDTLFCPNFQLHRVRWLDFLPLSCSGSPMHNFYVFESWCASLNVQFHNLQVLIFPLAVSKKFIPQSR